MSAIRIIEVRPLAAHAQHILGHELSSPKAGEDSESYALKIAGWILGRSSPAVSIELVDLERMQTFRTVPVDVPTPQITARYPNHAGAGNCGFQAVTGVPEVAEEFELLARAVFADGQTAEVAKLIGRRDSVSAPQPVTYEI